MSASFASSDSNQSPLKLPTKPFDHSFIHDSLSDLSNNTLARLVEWAKLLPKSEWPPLMYSAKILHLNFLEELLSSSGVVFRKAINGNGKEDGDLKGCELEISSPEAFVALRHWRRSAIFQPIHSILFIVSGRQTEWPVQMGAILDFLHSLPTDSDDVYFSELDVYMDGTADGSVLDGSLIVNLAQAAFRSRCASFTLHTSDNNFALLPVAENSSVGTPHLESRLRTLRFNTSLLSNPHFLRFLRTWSSSWNNLAGLHLCFTCPASPNWPSFISLLRLPNLLHALLSAPDPESLFNFFGAHHKVITFELSNTGLLGFWPCPSAPLLQLKSLKLLTGPAQDVDRFLQLFLVPSALHIDLELDTEDPNDTRRAIFDTPAHLKFFRALAGRDLSRGALHIKFPDVDCFTEPFFELSEDIVIRPERAIRVVGVHVTLHCFDSVSVSMLLPIVSRWVLLFPCLEYMTLLSTCFEISDLEIRDFLSSITMVKPELSICFC
ncbi:hypothetical protein SCHPADRAFT_1003276 [Schizopora paradoxa]|uniref:F-box domain-containing protein n=1 Tax=Schizopora paradoxa TaxID=27342 RepID=A0A0H2QY69_9AGAM|nr:hypothetical protein SCHPADRAFT_1003276 [Schizopora paradoxa]